MKRLIGLIMLLALILSVGCGSSPMRDKASIGSGRIDDDSGTIYFIGPENELYSCDKETLEITPLGVSGIGVYVYDERLYYSGTGHDGIYDYKSGELICACDAERFAVDSDTVWSSGYAGPKLLYDRREKRALEWPDYHYPIYDETRCGWYDMCFTWEGDSRDYVGRLSVVLDGGTLEIFSDSSGIVYDLMKPGAYIYGGYAYYINWAEQSINRVRFEDGARETLCGGNIILAVAHGKLYFQRYGENFISVLPLDGSGAYQIDYPEGCYFFVDSYEDKAYAIAYTAERVQIIE